MTTREGGTEVGRQPEDDGRLMCLSCGQWFRLLPPHLGRAHSMSAAEYRAAYQLPRRLSLRAADLNETARAQGRARYSERPDIRAAMAAGRDEIDPGNAVAASRETARYEMVLHVRRRAGQAKADASRRRIDARAQRAGYPTIEAYFDARQGASAVSMARELDVARSSVSRWLAKVRPDDS